MTKTRVLLAAMTMAMVLPSVAWGADDFRPGSQDDPQADATISTSFNTDLPPARLLDVRRVTVDYDAGLGTLAVRFYGTGLSAFYRQSFSFGVSVSAPNPNGACDAALRPGDFRLVGSEHDRAFYPFDPSSGTATLYDENGYSTAGSYQASEDQGDGPRMTFQDSRLLRRNYRCVSGVYAIKADRWYSQGRDDVASFCLAQCPPDPPPVTAAQLSADGTSLSWTKVGDATSYMIATSTAPEGYPGRNTTYAVVTGTSWTPPVAAGATRYYGVRVNRADAPWSTPEASITFATPPPPPTPTPPPVPVTGGSNHETGGGGPDQAAPITGPIPVEQNRSTTVQMTAMQPLTVTDAKAAVAKVLVERYGTAFRKRTPGSYRVNCAPTGAKATCAVSWRNKRARYKGTATVTRAAGRNVAKTSLERTTSSRPR